MNLFETAAWAPRNLLACLTDLELHIRRSLTPLASSYCSARIFAYCLVLRVASGIRSRCATHSCGICQLRPSWLCFTGSQQPSEEQLGGISISPGLMVDINRPSTLVNCPPETTLLAVELHNDLVSAECVAVALEFKFWTLGDTSLGLHGVKPCNNRKGGPVAYN